MTIAALFALTLPFTGPLLYAAVGGSLMGIFERIEPSRKPVTAGDFLLGLIFWPLFIVLGTGWICYHKISGREMAEEQER